MPAFFACMAADLCFRAFLQYAIWKRTPQKMEKDFPQKIFSNVKIQHINSEDK